MTTEKFPHLEKIDPQVENILKIPVQDIKNEHLFTLKDRLDIFSKGSNPEVAKAAYLVIGKIDEIINLWNTRFSWEIMEAANNPNYVEEYFDSLKKAS